MIILLTNEFPPMAGGVATYCYGMTRALRDLKQPVGVIAANKTVDDFSFDQKQPLPIYRTVEYSFSPLRHISRFKSLARYTRTYQPSFLWAADWRTGIVVSALSSWYNLPYAVTAYGSEILLAQSNALKRTIALRVYNAANVILSISNYTKSLLMDLGISEHKITVTPLGVDPGQWRVDPNQPEIIIQRHNLSGKKIILSLARLTPRKGHDTVLRALPMVLRSVPEVVYLVAGRGEDEGRLRRLAAKLGLENYVVFAGYVSESEKPAYYHACDVYAMLSRQEGYRVEGFGLTLLEAAACEKPVVAGKHGGAAEAVVDGLTGFVVDSHDPDAVANALIRPLTDQCLAEQLGQNARRRVETEANWRNVVRRTLYFFEGVR